MDRFKRFVCVFLSFLLIFSNILFFPVKSYADYEPDDDFFAFYLELVKQRNVVAQAENMYDHYEATGLSFETLFNVVKEQLSNVYTDTQAGLASIKTTYKNLTDGERWKLIDFYNQVDINTSFNIDVDLYNELNLDLFSNNVLEYYNYKAPDTSDYFIPVSRTYFREKIYKPFMTAELSAEYIDKHVNPPNNRFFDEYPNSHRYYHLFDFSPYVASTTSVIDSRIAIGNNVNTSVCVRYLDHSTNTKLKYTVFILSSPWEYVSNYYYSYAAYPDGSGPEFSDAYTYGHYFIYRVDSQLLPVANLYGAYEVFPDYCNIYAPQEIISNYIDSGNVYNVDYITYTPNIQSDKDCPIDEDWMNTVMQLLQNKSVPVINITINPPPKPDPDPPGDGDDDDDDDDGNPVLPPDFVVDVDFTELEEGLVNIIENQGEIINAVNSLNYNIGVSLLNISDTMDFSVSKMNNINNSLSDIDYSLQVFSDDTKNSFDSIEELLNSYYPFFEDFNNSVKYLIILLLVIITVFVSVFVLWLFYKVITVFF